MTLDDISHAAHVGHLQGRIGELEAKLREAEDRAEKAERECGRLQKMLDVCSVVHGHNVKLKSERDAARERLRMASRYIHDRAHGGAYGGDTSTCAHVECLLDRAALGEKP